MQMDINFHFDLNSCSHEVKIEVKQVDDNNTWLYNENQYLYVELSDFLIMDKLSSTVHKFQLEGSIGNKTTCTQDILYPRASYLICLAADIRLPPYIYFVWAYLY